MYATIEATILFVRPRLYTVVTQCVYARFCISFEWVESTFYATTARTTFRYLSYSLGPLKKISYDQNQKISIVRLDNCFIVLATCLQWISAKCATQAATITTGSTKTKRESLLGGCFKNASIWNSKRRHVSCASATQILIFLWVNTQNVRIIPVPDALPKLTMALGKSKFIRERSSAIFFLEIRAPVRMQFIF